MVRFLRLPAICGLVALCSFFTQKASATTSSPSGNFAADNSTYELSFTVTGSTNFSANTTSFAAGGFLPVLTLFNDATGIALASDGSGPEAGLRDASLSELLDGGTYDLFLTEFPNTISPTGNLHDGFLFAADPTATGDFCGVAGGMFLDAAVSPCTQRTSAYALTVNINAAANAVTPEPSSFLLMLLPLAGIVALNRRRFLAADSL